MTEVLELTAATEAAPPETKVSGAALARVSGAPKDERRKCLSSGELKPRAEMVRFVIGPDQAVVPDLSEKLPGHGLWVSANPDAITHAAKKNLFAKAAKQPAKPAADLADTVLRLLRRRCLDMLGLAKGAGIATLGESQTEAALRARKLGLYLHAPDATRNLDNRHAIPECAVFSRDELGGTFGYDHIVYAGLGPHGLTEKIKAELGRLQSMMGEMPTQASK